MNSKGVLKGGEILAWKLGFTILGSIFILFGLSLWVISVLVQKISEEIKKGELVTTGVYSVVRNPIYSAFLFVFTGIILTFN